MTFHDFLWGVALPAVVSGVVWFIVAFPLKRDGRPRAGGSLAFAISYLCAHYGIGAPMRGADVTAWMPWIAAAAGAAGVFEVFLTSNRAALLGLRGIAAIGIVKLLLAPRAANISFGMQLFETAIAAAFIIIAWAAASRAGRELKGFYLPAVLWLIFSVAAVLLVISGSGMHGQLSGALAAATGPIVILSFWMRPPVLEKGASAGAIVLFYPILILSYYYSYMPLPGALSLAAAPILTAVPVLLTNRMSPARARFVGFALVAAALGAAAFFVLSEAPPSDGY